MDASPTLTRVESGSPVVQYPRSTLLALYASPLVPDTLHGMKPLSEWYGEYQDPPSSPPTRTREAPASGAASRAHNNSSCSSNHTSNSGSSLSGGRPNPFANFGRFGVDGGLDAGDVAGFTATKSASSINDKRSRDGVPHLQREGMPIGGRTGARRADASVERTSPTKSSAFGNDRLRTSTKAGGADERNGALGPSTLGRRDDQKKDRRAPNEGGWRSAGGLTDRDRRTGRGNEQSRDLRDLRNDKRDRNGGLSSSAARGQRQPAWMDSDGPNTSSGSAPSWMDTPISSESFELGGRALPPHDRERGAPSSSGVAGAPEGGVDSIAAFKKQMKELERIRSSGGDVEELKQPSESVFASLVKGSAQQQSESQSSTLDSLRSGGDVSTCADEASAPREGGRSSRFAKYFDGKPPAPATSPNVQPQQAPSVFEALLGGGVGGASKGGNTAGSLSKDAESMARLMGMLQVSSARATSPVNSKSTAPVASPPALPSPANAPVPPHPHLNGDRLRQTSGSGSRFAFSQPPSNATQSALASSQPHEHQHQAQLSSRSVSASQSGPAEQPPHSPPRQSNNQATHAFALTPLGSSSTEGRPQPQQPSQQHHHHLSAHSRAGLTQPLSPPVSANFELPPSGPHSPGGMPPPPPQFFQMLNGMQSPPPQQQHMNGGVASRSLPPINNGLLPQQVPAQQHQQQGHPIPGGPHQMPHFQSPPPPPPHMGFGNSTMSPEIAAAHMRAMSNPSRSQPPPFNMPPPPFIYGGPPPPIGSMAPNMPPFPAHFRPPPPPGPFSGAGVPDLMALLNSGGGPRIGAASAPLPPRAPSMPQGQLQQQQQQHSMRQFMSPPPMNHGQ